MAKEISFLHAADLHLDSPFQGLKQIPEHLFKEVRSSTFTALDRLVHAAVDKQVDFVLLAGDLFDNEKQSLKAQVRLRRAFETLAQHNINVYLSYGNHDYIDGNTHTVSYPDNVFIFPDEQITYFTYMKNGQQAANIYGFSYKARAVHENKAAEFEVQDKHIPYHIAMLHGSLHSNTEHDVYAPFYIGELSAKDFDYWALGHIHKREVLKKDPYIIYPGNTQGRSRKEQGEKGCYHVTLSQHGNAAASFIPLQAIQFLPVAVDVSGITEVHHIEKNIQRELKELKETSGGPQLIELHLTGEADWETGGYLEEVIELVNETNIHQKNWQYIYRYTTKVRNAIDPSLYKGEHFVGELLRHFDDVSVHPFVKDLYEHRQARKYLESMTVTEEQQVKEKAKQLLVNELLMEGDENG